MPKGKGYPGKKTNKKQTPKKKSPKKKTSPAKKVNRSKLNKDQFAKTNKKTGAQSYPINDAPHAAMALARADQAGDQDAVYPKVAAKFPKVMAAHKKKKTSKKGGKKKPWEK